MNRRLALGIAIGVVAQVMALACYSWLAAVLPQSPLKYLGFAVLLVGSIGAAQLLIRLSRKAAALGFVVMALAAPLVPLIWSPKAGELLSDLSYYAPIYAKAFAVVFVCYVLLWGALIGINALRQRG